MPRRPFDRVLRVDLTAERVESEAVPEKWLRRYVGGKGVGARYLYEELSAGADPLGPENVLLFVRGPLSGALPGEPRYAAVTKSPLTGAFLDSYGGGEFAAGLAGALGEHVGVLVTGRAERPVKLEVEDGAATISSAEDLWGADAVEACGVDDAPVACVGPAGEHRVAYATIASDGGEHHAGRGGAGAVMGAKRLKAVVARGDRPDDLRALREEYAERFRNADVGRWQAASGTLESVDFADEVGVLSTRGWQEGRFDGTEDIGIEAARAAARERERDDDAVPGGFRVETDEGEHVPRGANAMSLGAGLGIDEFDGVAVLGGTCDRLGVDVISAGSAVAWAIRASQEGIVERDLRFGDPDGARALIEEIARRETPLGDALADGVSAAAASFGGDDLVPTVKAMEVPPYDPRGAKGMALAYATSDRGGCHRRARPVETEVFRGEEPSDADRVRGVIAEQNARSVLWSLIIDDFVGEVLRSDLGAEWLSAVGYDYEASDLRTVGERIWTLVRLFNVREGFSRADDGLPAVFTEPLTGGPADGEALDPDAFEATLERYYAERGWGEEGRPARALLERLDLADAVDDATGVASEPVGPPNDG
ncbi:aldehyde ferredoxin oxidoreductase family protein [Haladaptatus salinisoli]|uniref:aldehyde ferredoxin oxidoreductase family protein n=1 Tax=Haladaptatus salinisoli TaxID=2884876 RepID=UPI001D09BB18|nr:aldehyde ferredoxin oxidoreductase C-terminal domain-containing protein [Haladaptatus salinisoli]